MCLVIRNKTITNIPLTGKRTRSTGSLMAILSAPCTRATLRMLLLVNTLTPRLPAVFSLVCGQEVIQVPRVLPSGLVARSTGTVDRLPLTDSSMLTSNPCLFSPTILLAVSTRLVLSLMFTPVRTVSRRILLSLMMTTFC